MHAASTAGDPDSANATARPVSRWAQAVTFRAYRTDKWAANGPVTSSAHRAVDSDVDRVRTNHRLQHFSSDPVVPLERRRAQQTHHVGTKSSHVCSVLRESSDLADGIGGDHLGAALPLTGMFATHVPPGASAPTGLQLTVSNGDAEYATQVDINSAACEMDLEPAKAVLGKQAFWNDHVAVLGSVDGAPASGAAVLNVDGCR